MSVHSGPNVPKNDVVFLVDTGNPKSYTPNATIWYDLSRNQIVLNSTGNTTNATIANGALCIQFNNSGSWATSTADGQKTDLRFGATIIFLYQSDGPYVERDTILEKTGTITNSYRQELAVTVEGNNGFTYYRNANNAMVGDNYDVGASPSNYFNTNQWTHTVITLPTMPGGVGSIYKNGVLVSAATYNLRTHANTANLAGAIVIGTGYAGVCESGKIAMVKFYNRVLTAEEIIQDYNALRGRFGL
jgi:hypothetical protein